MGKTTGFMEYQRELPEPRPVEERVKDYGDIYPLMPEDKLQVQAARCMDCGIPFCQGAGCPVVNMIPEFNDHIYHGQWKDALQVLHSTNNFPEFTGRVCPAPCEPACVVARHGEPVAIKQIELQTVEKGFEQGWIKPEPPNSRTGKSVVVVGSGVAGLACAQQLNRVGHNVVLYEKSDRLGGLLRYGIPDFKLDKGVIDRRLRQMEAEGVDFRPGVHIGHDISARYLSRQYDALCLTGGAMKPRDLPVPGRDLKGVHFAMEYLEQSNRRVAGVSLDRSQEILATGKRVVVIGGGDTGADCVGTANRQGALSVHQFEIMPEPPTGKNSSTPWPQWPDIRRESTSHKEGCVRRWSVMTREFIGDKDGNVIKLRAVEVEFGKPDKPGQIKFVDKPGSDFEIETDLVLLAMGFIHPVHEGMINELGLELNPRGSLKVNKDMMTSEDKIFAAGDMVLGASLIVRALYQGRQAARGIDKYLMGETDLI